MNFKSHICPHGNRDEMKEDVQKNSSPAQFIIIRLVQSDATCMHGGIGMVVINGGYFQSGPIKRSKFVRPPRESTGRTRESICQLLKILYGITEAGRQRALFMESWLTDEMKMDSTDESHKYLSSGDMTTAQRWI